MRLKDIATVSSGVTFRSRIEVSEPGNIRVIQMKDLDEDDTVNLNQAIQINYIKPKLNQLVMSGDIIFRSRGQTNTAALLQKKITDAIVAAPLFRIRPNPQKVIPEYLLWWINQPSSQTYLSSQSKGTMVKMISKQALEDLEINLPTLERQHKIADFFCLSIKEQQLLEKIKNCRSSYVQEILMQMTLDSTLLQVKSKKYYESNI